MTSRCHGAAREHGQRVSPHPNAQACEGGRGVVLRAKNIHAWLHEGPEFDLFTVWNIVGAP